MRDVQGACDVAQEQTEAAIGRLFTESEAFAFRVGYQHAYAHAMGLAAAQLQGITAAIEACNGGAA